MVEFRESCGNCYYWRRITIPGVAIGAGECCKLPPVVVGIAPGQDGKPAPLSAQPPAGAEQWCGEWRRHASGL